MKLLVLLFIVEVVLAYDPSKYCVGDPLFLDNSRPGFVLLQAQLLTRHGDRTPVYSLPPALEKNVVWNCSQTVLADVDAKDSLRIQKSFMPGRQALQGSCMCGQLTAKGEAQLEELGRNFRNIYVDRHHLLSEVMEPEHMLVRSTDVERTIRSAYHFLTGLYPNSSKTLEIEVIERQKDNAFPNKRFCPQLAKRWSDIRRTPRYKSFFEQHLKPLQAKYSHMWGFPVSVWHLNDVLRARFCHNFPMPIGLDMDDAKTIMWGVSELEKIVQADTLVQKLAMGSFFNDWLANFEMVPRPRFVMYSNHDTTIRSVLASFHAYKDVLWPPYASHMVFELWEELETGKYFVILQYDGRNRKMKEPCEGEMCSFQNFIKLLKSFRTVECDSKKDEEIALSFVW